MLPCWKKFFIEPPNDSYTIYFATNPHGTLCRVLQMAFLYSNYYFDLSQLAGEVV